jgi:hypothetical protein
MDKNLNENNIVSLNKLCEKLILIFQDEEGVYLELIKKEDLKKSAIIDRNTEKLLQISKDQENILNVVDKREKERSEVIHQISEQFNSGKSIGKISDLADMPKLPVEMKEKLLHHSFALRELMYTLKNITGTNQEMLQDSKSLFDSLIQELSETPDSSYGPDGNQKKSKNPVFVNLNG